MNDRVPCRGTGWLVVSENLLERVPAQAVLPTSSSSTQLAGQDFPANLFPKLHVGSHSWASLRDAGLIGADAPIFPVRKAARL